MWSSINEQITDGTSGLAPNGGAIALVVGTSSKGKINTLVPVGKKSDIYSEFGCGSMPRRLQDMQMTMGDVSVLAMRTEGDESITITSVTQIGDIAVEVLGTPLVQFQCEISVQTPGKRGEAKINVVVKGDKNQEYTVLIPEIGALTIPESGIELEFPTDAEFTEENIWKLTADSSSSYAVIEKAVKEVLEVHTPEFIFIAQEVDADFVKQLGTLSELLFEDHKPVLFLTETSKNKVAEFATVDARFVSVVCQDGYVLTATGKERRSASGLCAGHITKARVNQSIGATNYFGISQYELLESWTNVISRDLDNNRFITLRTYAGLNNLYWSNGRTVASDKSDYRFIEVVRTVFKAIRLARRASLPYIQAPGDTIGLQNLLTEVRNSIEGMTTTTPKELDAFDVDMPEGQDVVNNGVRLDISLFGIPVIRKIVLNFMFKYNKGK